MHSSSSVSLFEHFSQISDPRIDRTKRHLLLDIIGLSICGVICGAEGWTDIESYGKAKESLMRQWFRLPHGIPSHDTIGRVFARIAPRQFQACFQDWIQAIATQTAGQVIAIDGKTLRRSYDRHDPKAAVHMVSAWASTNRLVLGQLKTDTKSNEITAIPELLNILALEGCIVTIDAMGCQKEIAAQIVEQGADYVLALKGNQGTIHHRVVDCFEQLQQQPEQPEPAQALEPNKPAPSPESPSVSPCPPDSHYYETVDGDHGRIEIRRYWQVSDLSWLPERSQWKDLSSVGMVETERHVDEQVSWERRYYLSSLSHDVTGFAEAARSHWGIENSVHWVLDVAFREDDCRIRNGFAPENVAVLRHIALNLLRQDDSCPNGIKTKRLKAGWDDHYLAHLLFQSDG